MNIDFIQVLNEKMGVISRVTQTTDVFHISELANKFIDTIYSDVNKPCTLYEFVLDHGISLKYNPVKNPSKNGESDYDNITIYLHANNENKLRIKYIIIHELIHIVQQIRKNYKDNYDIIDLVRYYLRKPALDNIIETDTSDIKKYKYFLYLIYREDIYEIPAWGNDAYIMAYKCKMSNQKTSNQSILKYVLEKVSMTSILFNNAIESIKYNDNTYNIILGMLIGHFSELDGNNEQSYFDKSVFNLHVIKNMRKDTSVLISKCNGDAEWLADELLALIDKYENELFEVKDIIINSFIKHLRYWYKKALVQLGKAIQLGIDDGTVKKS